jgi:hypothetical protein
MRSHRQISAVVGLSLAAALGAGCGGSSSSKPSEKVLTGRVKTGMKSAIETAGKAKFKPGSAECTVTLDDKAKTATYACKASTSDGKLVAITGSSTYAQIKDKKKKALSGTFSLVVDGAAPVKIDCVGTGC